ncbi:serine/threonine-protein phosphatase 6 regulatory ankyrin repeat subunit B-like [Watersipora subatra]|uniref:serine/threonine-protein phosphatase 6 regulatory ankyrin repeat subunit B-like n=1 Tax=Watersipora subatra TaxID=2589382 RepID=UPI00355BA43A
MAAPKGSSESVEFGDVPAATILRLCMKSEWGQTDSILRTLEKGCSEVNYSLVDGVTPLMLSCKENKIVIAERLLELGASPTSADRDGKTVMHYAAQYAKDDIVRSLISKKTDVNVIGGLRKQLPLHIACSRGLAALGIVQQILKGSPVEARYKSDQDGVIALFYAAEAGSLGTCKELLLEAAENQVTAKLPTTGDTILHLAAQKKDSELAKLACERGASVNAQNHKGFTPLHISAEEGDENMIRYLYFSVKADPNICDKQQRSVLHAAAERGHTTIVDLLVDKIKADPLTRSKDGSTLIHAASSSGHAETAIALLRKGVPLMMPNKNGAICLHMAAQHGHVSVVKSLLAKGAAVDAKTKDQYTALHIAVEACQPLVIQTLLGYGAQVELKGGKTKETPLHIAARITGAEQCVDMLIKCGADVNNYKENGETALHIAARYGHLKVVQSLLLENSDPTSPSKTGETPVHISVRYCHWEVCNELLQFVTNKESKFDTTILVNQACNEGETAVHLAAEILKSQIHHDFEDTDLMKLLLEYGGDTNIPNKLTMETAVHYCARAGNADIMLEIVKRTDPSKIQIAVNKQSKNGWSPLLVASKEGHLEIVKILLQTHARVDVFDEHGKAALHLAAESGHTSVADTLLEHKAFVNVKSKIGLTPLHLASRSGFNGLVKLLIETHGATVDALSLAKKTSLHMAAEVGQMVVCNTLLKLGADPNATDEGGQTPLHLAAENDHSDVIKLFLKHKPDLVTMANTKGMTYAHIAASKGSVGVIRELMRFNRTVICTAKNSTNASTSLHLAAEGGHDDVVQVLLSAGADPLQENLDGMTPLHLAAKHGHVEVVETLKNHLSLTTSSSKNGFTALHVAAHFGQTNTVRELLTSLSAAVESVMVKEGTEHGLTPLHLAAQSGHEGLVRVLLNSPGVKVDAATSIHGSIPLHLAAQNGHTSVASLLLSKSTLLIHIQDKRGRTALHLAASHGMLEMVAMLLGQGTEINAMDKSGWTALHYASKAGHLDVVKLLADSGASTLLESKDNRTAICYAAAANHTDVLSYLMSKEHNTKSLMEDKKFLFDLMVCGRLNDQSSIEEFVNLSPAPSETAAKMSRSLLEVAAKEKERSKDLEVASQFCEQMATELTAIAASSNSPSRLLKSVDSRGISFLDVLIECSQKEVVAHPTIQKYLSDVWMGGIQWKTWKIVLLFASFICCPLIWIVFSLPLKHRYSKIPIFKFMSYLVSHVFFVLLLVLVCAIPVYPIYQVDSLIPNGCDWLLLAWFSGLLVAELTNPGDRAGLGWIKVINIFLGAGSIVTHFTALAFDTGSNDFYDCLFIRNQILAVVLLLCCVQVLDFLSFHHLFGPWAIIISSLVFDLVKFVVILAIFMLGFTFHLSAIYQQVYPTHAANATLGDGDGNAGAKWLNPWDVFEFLFFSLFGLVEPENLPPVRSGPLWSRDITKFVFGMYLIVTIIVLINLLIAMMSDTYQRIQAQSDTEWKFGRAKLIRNMNKTSSTPPPINLPAKLYVYLKVVFKHKGKLCSADGQKFVNDEEGLNVGGLNVEEDPIVISEGFLRGVRNSRVSPEDMESSREPTKVEQSVNWRSVVRKYYANKGMNSGDDNVESGDQPDEETKQSVAMEDN